MPEVLMLAVDSSFPNKVNSFSLSSYLIPIPVSVTDILSYLVKN